MNKATKHTRAEVAMIKKKGYNNPYFIDPDTGVMQFDNSRNNYVHTIYMNRALPQWWLDKLRS